MRPDAQPNRPVARRAARHSLSDREIILPWPEVERAVMILTASNVAVTGWETWAKYPDGRFGRALDDSAIEMEPATIGTTRPGAAFVQRAQRDVLRTIEAENGRWALAPDLEGGVPHFRLFTPGDSSARGRSSCRSRSSVQGLAWLGTRTDEFDEMCRFYGDGLRAAARGLGAGFRCLPPAQRRPCRGVSPRLRGPGALHHRPGRRLRGRRHRGRAYRDGGELHRVPRTHRAASRAATAGPTSAPPTATSTSSRSARQ